MSICDYLSSKPFVLLDAACWASQYDFLSLCCWMNCKSNTLYSFLAAIFFIRHLFPSSKAVFACKSVLSHSNFVFKLDICYFRNHMNSAAATNCQPVSYLLHTKGSAMLSSQLVAGLWSLFFPNYIPAWIIVLLKLPGDFLSLLSMWLLFSISYAWWDGGHNFFCLYHTLACCHTYFKALLWVSNFLPHLPVCMAPDVLNFSKIYLHTGLKICI